MSLPSWAHVKELLHQALALGPEARAKFLDEVCGSNAALRTELESLLSVGDELNAGFLEAPTPQFSADGEGLGALGLAEGQLFAERFQLVRKLGEGGMGQVWLAEQTAPVRRLVALKLIKAGMYDETVVHRFQAERQSLAIMDHPAIAKVFDAGITPQGQPYFVMEYVPGLPITEYCDQHKLNIRQRLDLFIQACDGVQHAHQKAIIHRDLKPANILVVEVDGKPVPRIIDFGLAKATTAPLTDQTLYTRFGQFMGTPGYMSPEQVNSNIRDIDTRTDVYSLGVILYELLTGMQPFEVKGRQRPSLEEWLRQLREEEPRRPSSKLGADRDSSTEAAAVRGTEARQLVSQLRGDLDWITMKALERDRERRYGAPSELAADLRRYMNHEPIVARPASVAYQLGKFARRHRLAAIVAAIVTALAIATSGAGLIAVRQNHEAKYQAAQALQAQARLLTMAAAQRLKDADISGAQGIILEVLTNPAFTQAYTPAAISVFQDVRAADAQRAVLFGHGAIVYMAAYSPDGSQILTASGDKTARIWDGRTGAAQAVLSGHTGVIYSAAYSPDGTRIVTASDDQTARIWDARSGKQLAVLAGHSRLLCSAAYSPDGARIATASGDKTARIWDARTGVLLRVLAGHADVVQSAAFSPDGARIVTASSDKTARIWNARTWALLAVLAGHDDALSSAAYSPDGTRIVTASGDKTARIWDAQTGAPLAVLSGHGKYVNSAAYSPDGAQIVTASGDRTARIWDAQTGAPLAVLLGHGGIVDSAAYSRDGSRIVTASDDRTARIWDTHPGATFAELSGHSGFIFSGAYSPDGARIVTASTDNTARIWDAHSGKQLTVLSGHGDNVVAANYSPDGAHIVTASMDKTARIWDARTGEPLRVLAGHGDFVRAAAYSPDGAHIVTASNDKSVRIWDAHLGKQLALLSGHRDVVASATYSSDGDTIVSASQDRTARIWDARTGTQLAMLSGHSGTVYCAAYSPDGTRIVTASGDKSARIWDARTSVQIVALSGHGDRVRFAAYSPDGARIVTASQDGTARIWDAATGAQLAALIGHRDAVYSAVYSPDGSQILTASLDKTARIWDARVPTGVSAQILWAAAAQTDLLADADRTQLGIPLDPRVRVWPTPEPACGQAAAPYDPDRLTSGALLENIAVDIAKPACTAEVSKPQHDARLDYQMGRTLFAAGDASGARQQFETAVAKAYRAARIDLADLLVNASAGKLDPGRAVSLYEQAWQEGVPIAAFNLGHLYEHGVAADVGLASTAVARDEPKAWQWYQKGADAGEPNALARIAEREENSALVQTDTKSRNARLLQAFRLYAAAAEVAREEAWPEDAWKQWRYRRASLARVLAQQGMMQQVADAYGAMLDKARARHAGIIAAD